MILHTICTHHTRRREPCFFASGHWTEKLTIPNAPKNIVANLKTPGACNWKLDIVDRIEFGYRSLCLGTVEVNVWLKYEERDFEGAQKTEDLAGSGMPTSLLYGQQQSAQVLPV
ncbi:hypothetical protein N0V85_008516 [Neurospora sp. IMI 360204]|nr:hypothetical protein N0V85_008516 [Neurospora sp. IMI 360204]